MIRSILSLCFLLSPVIAFSQANVLGSVDRSGDWPAECEKIAITSSLDGQEQLAYFYRSDREEPRPLIVSLHTWSGGYDQKDTLSWQCIEKDYHYIHPDFRGPNRTYQACGSPWALSDIDDAIDYALEHANVDTRRIHVIGWSGGGHATLLAYMRSRHKINSFSAWVPISNLVDWYYESEGRGNKYSREIALCTTGKEFGEDDYFFDEAEARKRSPIFMSTPVEERKNSKLYIYAGVHDGYEGSVPISQSLNFYNKVVGDFDRMDTEALIPSGDIINLLTYRGFKASHKDRIGGREIHYRRDYQDKVRITIFEGGHEVLSHVALDHSEGKSILTIGDSNGEYEKGWVYQLQKLRFEDRVFNSCISGNTIGFNNLGTEKRNTLLNVDRFIREGYDAMGKMDAVVIMLGTNDCKAVFADSLKLVPGNMKTLISKIRAHEVSRRYDPSIYIVSPPPAGPEQILIAKYRGSPGRIEFLHKAFRKIAEREDCVFVDSYSVLKEGIEYLTFDGIHLTPEGQKTIATIIDKEISIREKSD